MRFNLKLNEVQYIQKQFHFGSLLGVEKRLFPQFGVDKTLKSKGVIVEQNEKRADLSNEYRYLFSSWEKMRYSVVRPDSNNSNSFFCVLANESTIILLDQVGDDIAIELIDFSSDTLDSILFNMGEFDSTVSTDSPFNISLPAKDFTQLMSSHKDRNIEFWSNKLGISKDDLTFYLEMMNKEEDFFMYLCEDHLEQIGTLIKVVKTANGYYALKHVTPKDSTNEKMVMILGNAQMVINSIYIF